MEQAQNAAQTDHDVIAHLADGGDLDGGVGLDVVAGDRRADSEILDVGADMEVDQGLVDDLASFEGVMLVLRGVFVGRIDV